MERGGNGIVGKGREGKGREGKGREGKGRTRFNNHKSSRNRYDQRVFVGSSCTLSYCLYYNCFLDCEKTRTKETRRNKKDIPWFDLF